MPVHDIHWSQYPKVAEDPTARAWLTMQAGRNLAKHTVETYGRSMEDFLRFTAREEVRLDQRKSFFVAPLPGLFHKLAGPNAARNLDELFLGTAAHD